MGNSDNPFQRNRAESTIDDDKMWSISRRKDLMMETHFSRREFLSLTGIAGATGLVDVRSDLTKPDKGPSPVAHPFKFCLNTATIRGQKLGILREVEIAAQAGYHAIEPWVDSIDEFLKNGGLLSELGRKIRDSGLTVEGAIAFPEWIVDDDERRAKGLERAKEAMAKVAQIGGKRIAAPPAGANTLPGLDLMKVADRYRALLELGDQMGVVPQLELWGSSQNLGRLCECAYVAVATGHARACILADVFHLFKGGSDFASLRLLSAEALQVFHLNDYPADPPRDRINDGHRLFPGDGIAPLPQILRELHESGSGKVLSLELFNRRYWTEDPLEVAKIGIGKMRRVVEVSLAGTTGRPDG
jgi:2-keto-myo-inositol isomerase